MAMLIKRPHAASMKAVFRVAAWLLLLLIVVLSVVSPAQRPMTPAPHDIEHVIIFLVTGLAFGLGYATRLQVQIVFFIAFAAAIELIQLAVPGRHSRLSDFIVDALGASIGVGLAVVMKKRKDLFS
jgi:VanZ family protein